MLEYSQAMMLRGISVALNRPYDIALSTRAVPKVHGEVAPPRKQHSAYPWDRRKRNVSYVVLVIVPYNLWERE